MYTWEDWSQENELERELGKDKALEIVDRACDGMAVESTRKLVRVGGRR